MTTSDYHLEPLDKLIRDFRRRVSTGNHWLIIASTQCGEELAIAILEALPEGCNDGNDPEIVQGVEIEINGVQAYIITISKDVLSREKLDQVTGYKTLPGFNAIACECTHHHVIAWVHRYIRPPSRTLMN